VHRPASLLLLACAVACSQPTPTAKPQEEKPMSDALTVIHQRKSVRSYTGAPVDPAQLDQLVRAAMAAPSAVNKQPWAFVVVTDRALLDQLREGLPYAKMLDKAGAAIVVCAVPAQAHDKRLEMAIIDASAASQNLLLAAEALGLGAVWTAAYPYDDRMAVARSVLGIPADVVPLNVIPVGHPTGAEKPKEKFKPEKIHQNKWQPATSG